MQVLNPHQIVAFTRQFRFQGSVLRRLRIRNHSRDRATAEIVLGVIELSSGKTKRLHLKFEGVDEFRFQRRPGPGLVKLKEVRFGSFNGMMYLNLDAYAADGPLAVHDFRASDAFIAGRSLSWELVTPKPKATT